MESQDDPESPHQGIEGHGPQFVAGALVPSRYGSRSGVRYHSRDAAAVCLVLPESEHVENMQGAVHGGAIATLADISATAAVWNSLDGRSGVRNVVTVALSVNFLCPGIGALFATARVEGGGRKFMHVIVSIRTESGEMVAYATSVMRVMGK